MSLCPRCNMRDLPKVPALSRRDNKTAICSECGTTEAVFDLFISNVSSDLKETFIELEKEWLTRRSK